MNRAFIFTMDAVLALIPVFIIIASVSTSHYDTKVFSTITLAKQAQDAIHILTLGENPLLEQYIATNRSESSREDILSALNGTVSYSYMLVYNSSQTSGWEFVVGWCSAGNESAVVNSSMNNASDVYVAERIIFENNTRHDFRIYLWVE